MKRSEAIELLSSTIRIHTNATDVSWEDLDAILIEIEDMIGMFPPLVEEYNEEEGTGAQTDYSPACYLKWEPEDVREKTKD